MTECTCVAQAEENAQNQRLPLMLITRSVSKLGTLMHKIQKKKVGPVGAQHTHPG
jgi:hypothetical protein